MNEDIKTVWGVVKKGLYAIFILALFVLGKDYADSLFKKPKYENKNDTVVKLETTFSVEHLVILIPKGCQFTPTNVKIDDNLLSNLINEYHSYFLSSDKNIYMFFYDMKFKKLAEYDKSAGLKAVANEMKNNLNLTEITQRVYTKNYKTLFDGYYKDSTNHQYRFLYYVESKGLVGCIAPLSYSSLQDEIINSASISYPLQIPLITPEIKQPKIHKLKIQKDNTKIEPEKREQHL